MQQLGSVEVEVRANLAPLAAALSKAEADTRGFTAKVDRNMRAVAPTVNGLGKAFETSGQMAQKSAAAVAADMTNLRFQINDVVTGLASGGSPFTVLSQQAGQFSQILQGQSIRGAFASIGAAAMSMLNPINLGIAAIGLATYAATEYFSESESKANKTSEALKRHADIIGEIKDRYGEAAQAALSYMDVAGSAGLVLRAETNAADIKSQLDAATQAFMDAVFETRRVFEVDGSSEMVQSVRQEFGLLAMELYEFKAGLEAGRPDFDGFIASLEAGRDRAPEQAQAISRLIQTVLTLAAAYREAATAAAVAAQAAPVPNQFGGIGSGGTTGRQPGQIFTVPNAPRPRRPPNLLDFDPDYTGGGGGGRGGGGAQKVDQLARALERVAKQREEFTLLSEAIGEMGMEADEAKTYVDLLMAAKAQGTVVTDDLKQKFMDEAAALGDAKDAMEELRDSQEKLSEVQQEFGNIAKSAIGGLISDLRNGTSAGEAFANMLERIVDGLINMMLNAAFQNLGGLFGGMFGGMGGAPALGPNGPVISPYGGMSAPRIPTPAMGLAGNTNVQVINTTGQPSQTREVSDGRGNRKTEVLIGEAAGGEMQRPGSPMHQAARNAFGLSPALVKR